jgi:hypothetical protein
MLISPTLANPLHTARPVHRNRLSFGLTPDQGRLSTIDPQDPQQPSIAPTPKPDRVKKSWLKKKWPWLLALCSVGGIFGTEWNVSKTTAWFRSASFSEGPETADTRRKALANELNKTIENKTIDWPLFADCVALIADASPDDETFRRDLAYFFGANALFKTRLDQHNHGLKPELANTGYLAEQFHHYIGAATGETWWGILPTHLYNCSVGSYGNELTEYLKSNRPDKTFNQGDVRLFEAARQHRDDFLNHGRHSVAPNIRKLLEQSSDMTASQATVF